MKHSKQEIKDKIKQRFYIDNHYTDQIEIVYKTGSLRGVTVKQPVSVLNKRITLNQLKNFLVS